MDDSDSEGFSDMDGLLELEGDSHESYIDTEFDNDTVDQSVDADHQINPAILGSTDNQGEASEVEQPPPRENPVSRVGHLINFPVLLNPAAGPLNPEPEIVNPPPLSEEVENINESCDENYSRKRKARDLGKSICIGDYDDIDTGTSAYRKLQVGPAAGSGKASCSNCIPGVPRLTPDMIPTLSERELQLVNLNRVKEEANSILKEVILHMMYEKTPNQNNLALPVVMLDNNNELQAPSTTTTSTTGTGHGIHYSITENLMYNPYYYHYMIQSPTFRQLVAHLVTSIIEMHYTNPHDQPRHGEDKGPTGRKPP